LRQRESEVYLRLEKRAVEGMEHKKVEKLTDAIGAWLRGETREDPIY